MKKTFKIEFNDFGTCYVIAVSFSKAEAMFLKSGYGGENVKIKSISVVYESNYPLY